MVIDEPEQLLVLLHLITQALRVIAIHLSPAIFTFHLHLLIPGVIGETTGFDGAIFPYYTTLAIIGKELLSPNSLFTNQLILLIVVIAGLAF